MLRRVVSATALLLLAASPAAAQFSAEAKSLQRWQVVLKVQPHPLLSSSFREQLRRDIVAALQPAFGTLGIVEVIDLAEVPRDQWDVLWGQFDEKGFAALDAPRDLNGVKTHFLTLAYRDGQYHLESRQYDGFAGMASPVVRKQSVRAPELVGRTAGLMLERDLGVTGSIEPILAKTVDELKVTVRGGQLGPLDRLVKPGDVFRMKQIRKLNRPGPPPVYSATGKRETPAPGTVPPPAMTALDPDNTRYTLLVVKDVGKDGTLRCTVLSRYQNAVPATAGSSTLGYRCMKLGTVEGPLAVRLVSQHASSQKNLGAVAVRATERGFDAKADARDTLQYRDKEGVFRSARDYKNVACVTVSLGPTVTKTFPVPVLGPEPVALEFEADEKLEAQAAHMRSLLATSVRVADAYNAQKVCFEATAALVKAEKNARALARARDGFKAADEADKLWTDELARLKAFPDLSPAAARQITKIENTLAEVRQFNAQLDKYVKTLEAVVARENNPGLVLADTLNEQIRLQLGGGDVEEAINTYDQLVTLLESAGAKETAAEERAKRDKLKADWAPKDDAHKKAREYLLKTWPTLGTIPEMQASLKRIEAEVQVCMEKKDRYTLRKLLGLFSAAAVKLNDLYQALDPNADRALVDAAKDINDKLPVLEQKVTDFVNKKE